MSEARRNQLARTWLIKNDPEWDWAAQADSTDFVGAVRDNINTFGPDESRASRFFLRMEKKRWN